MVDHEQAHTHKPSPSSVSGTVHVHCSEGLRFGAFHKKGGCGKVLQRSSHGFPLYKARPADVDDDDEVLNVQRLNVLIFVCVQYRRLFAC